MRVNKSDICEAIGSRPPKAEIKQLHDAMMECEDFFEIMIIDTIREITAKREPYLSILGLAATMLQLGALAGQAAGRREAAGVIQ